MKTPCQCDLCRHPEPNSDGARALGALPESQPDGLTDADRSTFQMLQRAARAGALAVVASTRKDTQMPVAVLCAVGKVDDSDDVTLMPLGELYRGNPMELLSDPVRL